MTRTLAELDYSDLLVPGRLPVMITLTLPGDWVTVAPTPKSFKRLVEAFRKRWERRWGERLRGVWKLEFQRRGAPHLHFLTSPPTTVGFQSWLSQAWADVVAHPDSEQRANHVLAGTGVDTAAGFRGRDPRRIAVYFSKHGSYGGKAYQDRPPDEWSGATGRIWGYWGLRKATAEIVLTETEAVQVQRILRRLQHARRVRVQRRVTRLVRPEVVNTETGEVVQEAKYRTRNSGVRMGKRHIGAIGAGFQVVNDGPALAGDLARFVAQLREDDPS